MNNDDESVHDLLPLLLEHAILRPIERYTPLRVPASPPNTPCFSRWISTEPSKARIVYGVELAQRDGAIEIVP